MEGVRGSNFELFRDRLASPLIENSANEPSKKSRRARGNWRRKMATKPVTMPQESNDTNELAEFIDVGVTPPSFKYPVTNQT